MVQLDGHDVGVMLVEERAEELFLGRLEVLPAFQRRGIGSGGGARAGRAGAAGGEAGGLKGAQGQPPRAALYQRLGFGVTGETETHYVMAWTP